jgi:uncharacterized damage-inducible protein DinB
METPNDVARNYLETVLATFRKQKALAEKAFEQLEPEQFHISLDAESNSLAVIIKHMSGNMRSRWKDFLTSDGEKPYRDRDSEFATGTETLEELLKLWEAGWFEVFHTLESLTGEDLLKTITIRSQPHTVLQAIERQVDHYAYHVGQIVFLAKHLQSDKWQTLSVARGQSGAFNQELMRKAESQG